MQKENKGQRNPMDFMKAMAQKSGKPMDEFMRTDGKKIRNELMRNRAKVSQYNKWLKGDI